MNSKANKLIALGTAGVMTAATFGGLGMTAAQASSKGRRNTTLALGAVTAYGLLKHKKKVAIAGGVGTAIAYSRYRKSKKREKAEEARRIEWYKNRYGHAWRNYYKPGA